MLVKHLPFFFWQFVVLLKNIVHVSERFDLVVFISSFTQSVIDAVPQFFVGKIQNHFCKHLGSTNFKACQGVSCNRPSQYKGVYCPNCSPGKSFHHMPFVAVCHFRLEPSPFVSVVEESLVWIQSLTDVWGFQESYESEIHSDYLSR